MEMHTEGLQWEQEIIYDQTQSLPVNLYVRLVKDTTIAENAAMADVTELTAIEAPGYAGQAIICSPAGWTSAGTGTNDRKVTGAVVTFTATGGDWPLSYMGVLTTTLTGTTGPLIASGLINFGAGRAPTDGQAFGVEFVITRAG